MFNEEFVLSELEDLSASPIVQKKLWALDSSIDDELAKLDLSVTLKEKILSLDKGYIYTYEESVCGLFGDSNLDTCLESGNFNKFFSNELTADLTNLSDLVSSFQTRNLAPRDLIELNEMEEVRKLAGLIRNLLDKELGELAIKYGFSRPLKINELKGP